MCNLVALNEIHIDRPIQNRYNNTKKNYFPPVRLDRRAMGCNRFESNFFFIKKLR